MQTMNSKNSLELMRGGQAKAVTLLHFLLLPFMVWCSFVASFPSLSKTCYPGYLSSERISFWIR